MAQFEGMGYGNGKARVFLAHKFIDKEIRRVLQRMHFTSRSHKINNHNVIKLKAESANQILSVVICTDKYTVMFLKWDASFFIIIIIIFCHLLKQQISEQIFVFVFLFLLNNMTPMKCQ